MYTMLILAQDRANFPDLAGRPSPALREEGPLAESLERIQQAQRVY